MRLEELYDEAMFDFSRGDYDSAIAKLQGILGEDPAFFDAQLSLGMAFFRRGDVARAILEGHKAEQLKPGEQLAHTNLSLFYLKAGDKQKAEEHGLKARVASWKGMASTAGIPASTPELAQASSPPTQPRPPVQFPDMPWKKPKT